MNNIRKIEIKNDDVYLSCTRFGISIENFKNEVLSATYKRGGQPALDKAIISMLLDDYCHVELSGDDPSILPYRKAIKSAEQQHILALYQNRMNQQYESYREKDKNFDKPSDMNISLKKYFDCRNKQIQEKLNAVTALIVR
jgi:hypothetical protein